ncbi:hypothetical protein DBR45_03395 [Pseudomonas sp. HMWF031]|nr:hypothetical protein DBR45_03395 [Pseudomonas sp. HMWF031]
MGSYYISEKQAALLLSRLTGLNINTQDMDEYSNLGITPAYIKFKPKDKVRYPGDKFQLVQPSIVNDVGVNNLTDIDTQSLMHVLPFPIPDCRTVHSSAGITFAVFVANSDRRLVEVSDSHYERVYAPQEVRLAAKNILRASSPLSIPAISHTCGETWEVERDHDHDAFTACIISPFANNKSVHVDKRHRTAESDDSKDKEPPCTRLVIAGMLQLIRENLGDSYNKTKINEELRKLMPQTTYRGMSKKSIDVAFSAASRAKENAELEAGIQPKRPQKHTK